MDIKLTEEDRSEILRYLGYRGGEITEVVEDALKRGVELANRVAAIRSVYRLFSLEKTEEGIALKNTPTVLTGKSIQKHLEGCERAVLFSVTAGSDFDREVEKLLAKDPTLAVILNACGIQIVEKALDELQLEIEERYNVKTGVRYSPGYGDLPLSLQSDIISLLNTERMIGVTINANYLMTPRKSVTAIAGIEEN